MYTESIDEDAKRLFYDYYSKLDKNDISELYENMNVEEIDTFYSIADVLTCTWPSFNTETEKYSLENVRILISDIIATCVYIAFDVYS